MLLSVFLYHILFRITPDAVPFIGISGIYPQRYFTLKQQIYTL